MTTLKWLIAFSLVALPVSATQISCTELECGEGTKEENGVCVQADSEGPDNNNLCGVGTSFDPGTQSCIPDLPPAQCDPDTSEAIVGPDGVITCVGTGVAGCDITCKNPDAGKVTVCGQLLDAETGTPLESGSTGAKCDLMNPTQDDGPCSLKVEFYDALEFASNPGGAPTLAFDELVVNDCGQFMGHNIPTPGLGFLAIAADDGGANDTFVFTGSAFPAQAGERRTGFGARLVKNTTDAMWATSAGEPFGAGVTFSDRGVFFPVYLGPDGSGGHVPVAGVQITNNGSVFAARDYYFSDTDAKITTVDTSLNATGANGAGLMVDSDLTNHGGTGAEPTGCEWPEDLADALPGVVFANERIAEDTSTGEECE